MPQPGYTISGVRGRELNLPEVTVMPVVFYFALMVVSGVFVALQPLINANLATRVGSVQSALVSFAVGTVALAGVVTVISRGDLRAVTGAHWWQLTGGILGAFFVTAIIIAVPRIGTTAALAATIASQLAAGAVFDHLGLLGGRHIPFDMTRGIGIGLLFAGAALVLRG